MPLRREPLTLFLSLLPPSCMVAPIRELVNIYFHSLALSSKSFQMVNLPSCMDMNINCNIIRKRSTSSSKTNLRESLILSNASSAPHYKRMEMNNNLPDEDVQDLIDSSQLFYNRNVEIDEFIRKMTNNHFPGDSQYIWNKTLALKNTPKSWNEGVFNNNTNICLSQDAINIQLSYNVNQATK